MGNHLSGSMVERLFTSQEVAAAAGLPYATLLRWLKAGVVLRRGPHRRQAGGGGLLWTWRDLQEARIAAGLRDYISRAEGPLYEIMLAVQALRELPAEPALHLNAVGCPEIVEYDSTSDDLRLFADPAVRREWVTRRAPKQHWLDQEEIHGMEDDHKSRHARLPASRADANRDLFEGLL